MKKIALRSLQNRLFVSARVDEADVPLRATRPNPGPYEEFELVELEPEGAAPAQPSPPAADGLFPLKGCTDFRLLQASMLGEDVASLVRARQACGANILRVLAMKVDNTGWALDPAGRADYPGDLRRFFDLMGSLAVRVYFTVFADTATLMPQQPAQQAFWAQVVETVRPYATFVVLELANEWNHPTQRIDPRSFSKPDGILASRGSALTDEDPASPYWDLAGYSARRNVPPDARGITNYSPLEFQAEYPMRVPKFAQEGLKPDDYGGDPAVAELMGRHAALGCGGFFHSNSGVNSRPFSDTELICATRFFEGVSR